MSFSWEKGNAIALLKKRKGKILRFNRGEIGPKSIYVERGQFQLLPNKEQDRNCIFVIGPSGVGKSFFCSKYIETFKKIYPKTKFILFSRKTKDPCLDRLRPVRPPLTEQIENIDFENDIRKGAVVLFDDISTIRDNKVRQSVFKLMDDLLEGARACKISVLVTNHLLSDGRDTRRILNEMDHLVIFPESGSYDQIRKALEKYFGLRKSQIDPIFKIPSRWLAFHKNFPRYVLGEKIAFLPN